MGAERVPARHCSRGRLALLVAVGALALFLLTNDTAQKLLKPLCILVGPAIGLLVLTAVVKWSIGVVF